MIPAPVVAFAYMFAGLTIAIGSRSDHRWALGTRVFLAVVLFAWAGFYALVEIDVLGFDDLRLLSRWLHLPLAVAVTLVGAARWYHSFRANGKEVG